MSQFTVTNVNLAKDQTKATKAFCDVEAGGLVHKGVRIVTGAKGFFISMKSEMQMDAKLDDKGQVCRDKEGKIIYEPAHDKETGNVIYRDIYFPKDEQTRNLMTSAVLAAYNAKVESAKAEAASK